MKARLYVEGGGDGGPLRRALRESFRAFFKKAGLKHLPRVVACGSRQHAYDDYLPICVSTVHSLVTETTQHCDSVLLNEMEKHEVFVGNGIEFQWLTLERVPWKYIAT